MDSNNTINIGGTNYPVEALKKALEDYQNQPQSDYAGENNVIGLTGDPSSTDNYLDQLTSSLGTDNTSNAPQKLGYADKGNILGLTGSPYSTDNYLNQISSSLDTSNKDNQVNEPNPDTDTDLDEGTEGDTVSKEEYDRLLKVLEGYTQSSNLNKELDIFGTAIGGGFDGNNATLGTVSGLGAVSNIARSVSSGIGRGKRLKEQRNEFNKRENLFSSFREGGGIPLPEELSEEILVGMQEGEEGQEAIANLEGGERVMQDDGNIQEVVGPQHEEGGVDVSREDIPGEANILSDDTEVGKENAEELNEIYGTKIKAKDAFSKAMEKIEDNLGLTELETEQEAVIDKLQKAERSTGIASDTKDLNKQEYFNQIDEIETQKEQLQNQVQTAFTTLYEMQEELKPEEERDTDPIDPQENQQMEGGPGSEEELMQMMQMMGEMSPQQEGEGQQVPEEAMQGMFRSGGKVKEEGGEIKKKQAEEIIEEGTPEEEDKDTIIKNRTRKGREDIKYVTPDKLERYYRNYMYPTSPWGKRIMSDSSHGGTDIAPKIPGSNPAIPVLEGGTVDYAGYSKTLGNFVQVKLPNGKKVKYGHMSSIAPDIKKGDKLQPGDIVGNMGNTGNVMKSKKGDGTHLHIQYEKGSEGDAFTDMILKNNYNTLIFSNKLGLNWKESEDYLARTNGNRSNEEALERREDYYKKVKKYNKGKDFNIDDFNKYASTNVSTQKKAREREGIETLADWEEYTANNSTGFTEEEFRDLNNYYDYMVNEKGLEPSEVEMYNPEEIKQTIENVSTLEESEYAGDIYNDLGGVELPLELYSKLRANGVRNYSDYLANIDNLDLTEEQEEMIRGEMSGRTVTRDESAREIEFYTNEKPEEEIEEGGVTSETPSQGTETPVTTGEQSEPTSGDTTPLPEEEGGEREGEDDDTVGDVEDLDMQTINASDLPNPFTSDIPLPPSSMVAPERHTFRGSRLSIGDMSADAHLAEINRQETEAISRLGSLPPAQRAEAEARILEQTNRNRDQVMSQVNQTNMQNQQNILNQNRQIADQEQVQNIKFDQDYEQKMFKTADTYEGSLRNWYDTMVSRDVQTTKDNRNFRLRNQAANNYVMMPDGSIVLAGEGYVADKDTAKYNTAQRQQQSKNKKG